MTGRVDRWMFQSFALTPRSLGIARIAVGAYLVLYRAPDELRWVRSMPDTFFHPPAGPFQLAARIPSSSFVTTVAVGFSIATIALLVGYHTRIASCATGVLLFTVDGLAYSFGDIHHDVFLVALPIVMAASNWGAAYSLDALRRRNGTPAVVEAWPVALAALLLGFLMLTAALPKLASGWLDPSAQAVRAHFVHHQFASRQNELLGPSLRRLTSPLVWKPLDYLTLLLEGGFIVAISSPRATRIFCALAVVFHLAVFVAFGLDFTPNVVAYAVFFQWSTALDRLHIPRYVRSSIARARRWIAQTNAPFGPTVLLVGVGFYALTVRTGPPVEYAAGRFVTNPHRTATLVLFGIALFLVLAHIVAETSNAVMRVARHAPTPT